jgi:nucleotidyltransferase AbiEii toxin of type IV toxin-antitoxin system
MNIETSLTPNAWSAIIASAYALFDDLAGKGYENPPFSLGGGTVLMFRFKHRLSKDIDFFGYDAQWLSLLSPRLNEAAAAMASTYVEQANGVKIVMPHGDIDFIIAGDVAVPVNRTKLLLKGRDVLVDPTSEILAKKLFYRAASLKARDVYDLSAAIDLEPGEVSKAAKAAASKKALLVQRLDEMKKIDQDALLQGLAPYDGVLRHAADMVAKVRSFLIAEMRGPEAREQSSGKAPGNKE